MTRRHSTICRAHPRDKANSSRGILRANQSAQYQLGVIATQQEVKLKTLIAAQIHRKLREQRKQSQAKPALQGKRPPTATTKVRAQNSTEEAE